jgi:hypothetical protein
VLHPGASGGRDGRLRPERDAEPRLAEHREIVCTVADGERLLAREAETTPQLDQGGELGFAAQDRLLDTPEQPAVVDQEPVRAILVEPKPVPDRTGEDREPARDETGIGAVRAQRRDERGATWGQADPISQKLIGHLYRQPLQPCDPLPQRRLEGDFTPHRAFRDRRDLCFQPNEIGELVDAFLLDHRRIHVGQEQPLAPAGGGLNDDVDRNVTQAVPQRRFALLWGHAGEREVRGEARSENALFRPAECTGCLNEERRRDGRPAGV